MKKTVITSALLLSLALMSTTVFAQKQNGSNGKNQERGQKKDRVEMMIDALDLNASQSDQVKDLQMQKISKIKPIKNELREKEARLITITTVSQPDKKAVANLVSEISNLKGQIFMIKSMDQLEVRSLLNEEQKMKFDQMAARKGRKHGPKA